MANGTPMKMVTFRMEKRIWDALGEAVGKNNRSEVLRQFIAWYIRDPGAKRPRRPGEEGFEEQFRKPRSERAPHLLDPQPHALYRFFDQSGELLYVGITMDLPARMGNHRRDKPWWTDAAWIGIEHFDNRAAALEAERMAIKAETPRYNVVHNGALADESGVPIP
jgi:predicted GIY-YIG superfamily endonuclease